VFPVDVNNNISGNIPPGASDTSTYSVSVSAHTGRSEFSDQSFSTSSNDGLFTKENTQSFKRVNSQDNEPLSPSRSTLTDDQPANSPVPNHYGNQYKHLLLNDSSSTSNSLETDNSTMSYGDFALTPPTAGSRPPLIVSAKRYGSEVRRQHNKCRRRRRRPSSTRSDSQKHSSLSDTENDNDALCLWKGNSPGETKNNFLPLLASSDEEDEQTDRIEEIVRLEHMALKEAMVARGSEKLQPKSRFFSANRAPPTKGCLSIPRPKRQRGHTIRYKTPPKSTNELDTLSESNVHLSRRVQFGIPSAVEYEIDRPPGHLTPMSQEVTRKRYSMNPKETTREEDEITQETKQNNLILSEWEDQFSNMRSNKSGSSDRLRRSGSSSKRNRRSSSIFSPASRISLIYDNSNQTSVDTKEKDGAFTSSSSDFKSSMDISDPASLSTLRSEISLEENSNHPTSQATPMSIVKPADGNQTWNFVADLGLFNSKGAMELSPHSSSPGGRESSRGSGTSTIMKIRNSLMVEENAPPPADVNLDTINTFGAAIDDDPQQHRPTFQTDIFSSDSVKLDNSSNIISNTLIATPWLDQDWDFFSLLRNLSFFRKKEEVTIQRCFGLLDPRIHNVLSWTSNFFERVMCTQSLKSKFPGNLSKKNSLLSNKNAIMTEWKKIEIPLIENLTNFLDQFRLEMEKTCVRNKTKEQVRAASDLEPENKRIEKEISKLENDIHQLHSSLDILEASIAPFSCILCQASAQIGVYGFYFEGFRGDHILELDYMHAIFGVKTRVIVDINSQLGLLIEHNDTASDREQNSIFDFHRGYINMLRCGKMSFQLDCNELQDSLLKLGQILGKLDQCALVFKAINDGQKATITVNFPQIHLTLPAKDTSLSLTLDLECFVTKNISVSTIDGSDLKGRKTEMLSSIDCCNLKSVSRIISQYE